MKEETIRQSILPVAQQELTCLIGTTTPQGSDNIVSQMTTCKDEKGKEIFGLVRLGKPCEECKKKRILCTHNEEATAEGLSRKKREKYKHLYAGHEDVLMREYMGETADASQQAFDTEMLASLMTKSPVDVHPPIDLLFMTIDPAQGGANDIAVLTTYYDRPSETMIVVQMDTIKLLSVIQKNVEKEFVSIVRSIRASNRAFENVPIVVACECAPKMFAEMIADIIEHMKKRSSHNVYMMKEMAQNRPGTPKTNSNTQQMVFLTRVLLEEDRIAFSKSCICSVIGTDVEEMKKKLIKQLFNFKKRYKAAASSFGNPTARLDGKEGGANDDLAVTFIMQHYWYIHFWEKKNRPEYEAVKQYSATWRTKLLKTNIIERENHIEEQIAYTLGEKRKRGEDLITPLEHIATDGLPSLGSGYDMLI